MFHYNNSRLFRLPKNTLPMKLHLREVEKKKLIHAFIIFWQPLS